MSTNGETSRDDTSTAESSLDEKSSADSDLSTDSGGSADSDTAASGLGDSGLGDSDLADVEDSTRVMPSVSPESAAEASDTDDEATGRITRDELYARQDRQGERQRLESIRAEHVAAAALDEEVRPVPAPAPARAQTRVANGKKAKLPRTTDKFLPSLGLFVLRLVVALSLGVHGLQKLFSLDQTATFFGTLSFFGTPLPSPGIFAMVTGLGEVLIAVALIFGFVSRVAGFGVMVVMFGALAMVKMTTIPNPLAPGAPSGFSGELELILMAIGVLILCVGSGAWSLDRLFRKGRDTSDLEDLDD